MHINYPPAVVFIKDHDHHGRHVLHAQNPRRAHLLQSCPYRTRIHAPFLRLGHSRRVPAVPAATSRGGPSTQRSAVGPADRSRVPPCRYPRPLGPCITSPRSARPARRGANEVVPQRRDDGSHRTHNGCVVSEDPPRLAHRHTLFPAQVDHDHPFCQHLPGRLVADIEDAPRHRPQLPHPYAAPIGQSAHNSERENIPGREDRPLTLAAREPWEYTLPMAKRLLGKPDRVPVVGPACTA